MGLRSTQQDRVNIDYCTHLVQAHDAVYTRWTLTRGSRTQAYIPHIPRHSLYGLVTYIDPFSTSPTDEEAPL